MPIKHIWLDFSETIARINTTAHDELKYSTYAKVVNKPFDDGLVKEFDEQYKIHNNSISDMFYSLGKPSGWWSSQISKIDASTLFQLAEVNIPRILLGIKRYVPVSIFSNINVDELLPSLGISVDLFDHVLSSGMIERPKPAMDGFYKIVELSKLKPSEILYIGDHVTKDIVPAKKAGLQAGIIWSTSDKADYSFSSFDEILDLVAK